MVFKVFKVLRDLKDFTPPKVAGQSFRPLKRTIWMCGNAPSVAPNGHFRQAINAMLFFNKRIYLEHSGVFGGFTDWHSHILPGVDDGVRTLGESLAILRRYEVLGVKTVWLTPHIMEDVPNTTAFLRQRFAELQAAYKGSVTLRLASENMLDSLFEERLSANDLLPLGDSGDRLLVETSYFNPPMNFHALLEGIRKKGYTPVLAHPERYTYMERGDYRQLKTSGIKLQLNLFSLVGFYGEMAKKKAEWLLSEGMYDLAGTDIHSLVSFEKAISGKISKSEKLSELTDKNTQ